MRMHCSCPLSSPRGCFGFCWCQLQPSAVAFPSTPLPRLRAEQVTLGTLHHRHGCLFRVSYCMSSINARSSRPVLKLRCACHAGRSRGGGGGRWAAGSALWPFMHVHSRLGFNCPHACHIFFFFFSPGRPATRLPALKLASQPHSHHLGGPLVSAALALRSRNKLGIYW